MKRLKSFRACFNQFNAIYEDFGYTSGFKQKQDIRFVPILFNKCCKVYEKLQLFASLRVFLFSVLFL